MDPLSHTTFALTLVRALGSEQARGGLPVRGAIAAAVLGALSPDIDAAIMPFGWDRYLRVHEIGTHTLVGIVVCGLLTAVVTSLVVRPAATNRRTRDLGVFAMCASIGAASHVLLDLLSSARLKPGWPFVDTVASLPVVAMADPWMLGLCVIAALAVRFAGRPRNAAILAVTLIAMFVSIKATLGFVAISRYDVASASIENPVLARVIEAEWGQMLRWRVADATRTQLRVWSTSTTQSPRLELSWTRTPESELVTRSRSFSTVRNFLATHDLVFSTVIHPSPPDTTRTDTARAGPATVLWSDIRFCWKPAEASIACALWMGGEIGADGQLQREIIRIGDFTQTRGHRALAVDPYGRLSP